MLVCALTGFPTVKAVVHGRVRSLPCAFSRFGFSGGFPGKQQVPDAQGIATLVVAR